MYTCMDALAIIMQHLGISPCLQCLTLEEQMCPDPWSHLATAVCHNCEAFFEYRACHSEDCPATATARLAASCRASWEAIDLAELNLHIRAQEALKDQFRNVEDPKLFDQRDLSSDEWS